MALASLFSFGQVETITDYRSPAANGKLILQVRNDSLKYVCDNIQVEKGLIKTCDNNPIVDYSYFIKRNVIDSSWLNDALREYDNFIEVDDQGQKAPWLSYEKKSTVAYKEDFTSNDQKTGITYKHHETRKNLITYTFANPKGKFFHDDKKYQFQYDWDENIKGRFEAFYLDGIKKFRHNYEINRIMSLDKGFSGLRKSSIDAQIIGTIQAYYANGKKKSVVTYTDRFVSEKVPESGVRKLIKSSREGEKMVYRENGKLFCKGSFNINGVDGKLEYFGPKGVAIIKVETYDSGVLNGKVTEFYLDGTVKLKGEYKAGEKVGEWLYFNEDGKKIKPEKN